jgi:hypothetical protein
VYIDNGDPGDSGELEIELDGHAYTEQENYSFHPDGTLDSVAVDTADGGHLVYTDTDHDGHADLVTQYDADGDRTRSAEYDAATGHWDTTPGGDDPSADSAATAAADGHGSASISVDTEDGTRDLGPATVDTNADGTPDTAVVHDANGDLIMYTDTDGDGHADVAVEISPTGEVVIAQHTGDHEWTEVEKGHLDANGGYVKDAGASGGFDPQLGVQSGATAHWVDDRTSDAAADAYWSAASPQPEPADTPDAAAVNGVDEAFGAAFTRGQGVVRIDAATGQWMSPN